jgi:3-dehydroquinate dehydratase-2
MEPTRVVVLNGPNLGRLGRRQPEIYGTTTHDELVDLCVAWGRDLGLDVEVRQTNHEGALLDWLNDAADASTPVVLNAAAWSHYSVISAYAADIVAGHGIDGYRLALEALAGSLGSGVRGPG